MPGDRFQYTIFDFRSPDATANLNEMHRGIIPPGVYVGFYISLHPTNAGQLVLEHAVNPDYAGDQGGGIAQTLGTDMRNLSVLKTRDGITCIQAGGVTLPSGGVGFTPLYSLGHQLESTVGTGLSNTLVSFATSHVDPQSRPRVDYLVARYTYATTTTPRVQYTIVTGTTPNDDDTALIPSSVQNTDIVLAEIRIRSGTNPVNFYVPGNVTIQNAQKKKLDNTLVDIGDAVSGYLRAGAYYGWAPTNVGTTVTLSPGGLISQDGDFVKDGANRSFDLAGYVPMAGTATSVAIAAINYPGGDTTSPELPYYAVVPGSPGGGVPPSNAAIAASAQTTIDPRVTERHVTPLCYVRLESGGVIQMSKTERIALPDDLLVTDGIFYTRSSYRTGSKGLRDTIDLIYGVIKYEANPRAHRIITEGLFLHDYDLNVPSRIEIAGWRSNAVHHFGDSAKGVRLSGVLNTGVTITLTSPIETITGPPSAGAGQTVYQITVSGLPDYRAKQFVYGDPVFILQGGVLKTGVFRAYTVANPGVSTFQAIFTTGALANGAVSIAILKTGASMNQAHVSLGTIYAALSQSATIGLVSGQHMELGYNRSMLAGNITLSGALTDIAAVSSVTEFRGFGNRINRIELTGSTAGIFGKSNDGSVVGMVQLHNTACRFDLYGAGHHIHDVYGSVMLACSNCLLGMVYGPAWTYAVVPGATASNNVILKHVGAVDPTNQAGTFSQVGATAKTQRGVGYFSGYQSGTVVPLQDYMEPDSYRVFIAARDITPNPAAPTNFGIAPIGEVWVDAGANRAPGSFVVRNSGWDTGEGPVFTQNLPAGDSNYAVTVEAPIIAGSLTVQATTTGGGPVSTVSDGNGPIEAITANGEITGGTVNDDTGEITITLANPSTAISISYKVGPWPFDWLAIQD